MRWKDQPRERRTRRIWRIALASLAVWSVFAWGAARALIVKDGVTRADALVVLSGSSVYRERARRAARLFHEGAASKIILTSDGQQGGWSQTEQRNPFFVERAAAELERAGVPRERVEMVPQTVTSTYTEALVLKDYATRHGITSLLVVTSGYHSRRARWSLRRVFKESGVAVGVEPVAPGDETASPVAWWLQPDGWRMVVSEYVKLIYYKWHYDD